jgi:hypothetical protein
VGGDKDGELLCIAPCIPFFRPNIQHHPRKGKNIIEEEFEVKIGLDS